MEGDEYRAAAISQNDVQALRAILCFYGSYLMRDKIPSAERRKKVMILQLLVFKLSNQRSLVLAVEELMLMKDALGVFISEVEHQVPGSQDRDGVLVSCEQLLLYINKSFAV
jgi:hypothetical protein